MINSLSNNSLNKVKSKETLLQNDALKNAAVHDADYFKIPTGAKK